MAFASPPAASDPPGPSTAPAADSWRGGAPAPLRNRNVGILCDDARKGEALAIQRATSDLGARVALVSSHLDAFGAPDALEQTAHVLGRLYDAVICIDLSPEVVRQLRSSCGVPVLADVASQWHVLRAARPEAGEDPRYLMQELLAAIGA